MKGRYRVDLIFYVAGRWVSVLYGYVALNLLTQNKASECELSRSRQPATLKSKKKYLFEQFSAFCAKVPGSLVLESKLSDSGYDSCLGTGLGTEFPESFVSDSKGRVSRPRTCLGLGLGFET